MGSPLVFHRCHWSVMLPSTLVLSTTRRPAPGWWNPKGSWTNGDGTWWCLATNAIAKSAPLFRSSTSNYACVVIGRRLIFEFGRRNESLELFRVENENWQICKNYKCNLLPIKCQLSRGFSLLKKFETHNTSKYVELQTCAASLGRGRGNVITGRWIFVHCTTRHRPAIKLKSRK